MGTPIDARLFAKLKNKLRLENAATYSRISKYGAEKRLQTHLAALSLAADLGININRYATAEDLATLRGTPMPPVFVSTSAPSELAERKKRLKNHSERARKTRSPRANRVFVVHGRNEHIRKEMFTFLRAAGVQPMDFLKAIEYSNSGSPEVSRVLDAAFEKAEAVVVLLTPDDEAKLRDEFIKRGAPIHERKLTPQARANVLFEAGMAFGTHSGQTILVEFGKLRPISDIIGRHAVRMDGSVQKRKELMVKLKASGCDVDYSSDWETAGDLAAPRNKK